MSIFRNLKKVLENTFYFRVYDVNGLIHRKNNYKIVTINFYIFYKKNLGVFYVNIFILTNVDKFYINYIHSIRM